MITQNKQTQCDISLKACQSDFSVCTSKQEVVGSISAGVAIWFCSQDSESTEYTVLKACLVGQDNFQFNIRFLRFSVTNLSPYA